MRIEDKHPEMRALLGLEPDREIARLFGVSVTGVAAARRRLKIASYDREHHLVRVEFPKEVLSNSLAAGGVLESAGRLLWDSISDLEWDENQDQIMNVLHELAELEQIQIILAKAKGSQGGAQ
jgi:hypothetical protein